MKKQQYDIFISYRRDTGRQYARILQMALEKIGYRVFLDYDELTDGIFGDNIRQAVLDAPIFMPILSRQYLVRCANEGDWVREEIMLAIKEGKHFVPINPDNTHDGIPSNIPAEIVKVISENQHSEILFGQTLNATMKLMVDNRLVPHIKPHPKNNNLKYIIALAVFCVLAGGALLAYKHFKGEKERVEAFEQCRTKTDYEQFIQLFPNTSEAQKCQDILNQMKSLKNDGRAYVCNTMDEDVREADKQMVDVAWDSEISLLQLRTATDIFNRMMLIPAKDSTFMMGRMDDISYDGPQHRVTLTEDFYICQYEITRGWWHAIMNDSLVTDSASYPVSNITCEEACNFAAKLRALTGTQFSLPTEAQWEWAAVGNSQQTFAGGDEARQVAWYVNNSDGVLHEVGTVEGQGYNDNELYDMSGNIAEWCLDYMSRYSSDSRTNPLVADNPGHGKRIVRGGSILTNERDLDARHRSVQSEDMPDKNVGFRLVFKK